MHIPSCSSFIAHTHAGHRIGVQPSRLAASHGTCVPHRREQARHSSYLRPSNEERAPGATPHVPCTFSSVCVSAATRIFAVRIKERGRQWRLATWCLCSVARERFRLRRSKTKGYPAPCPPATMTCPAWAARRRATHHSPCPTLAAGRSPLSVPCLGASESCPPPPCACAASSPASRACPLTNQRGATKRARGPLLKGCLGPGKAKAGLFQYM